MTTHAAAPARRASALRWLPTFLGFPLGGVAAELVAGPVDALIPALVGGALAGTVLGAVQAWALGPSGPPARRWIAATAAGLTAGLAIGSAVVGYGTSLGDLVVQGAVCGAGVGAAQALLLRGRLAALWPAALSALWALGWAITTAIGVDVETQYAVFGSSGAIVVTLATSALPLLLATGRVRSAA